MRASRVRVGLAVMLLVGLCGGKVEAAKALERERLSIVVGGATFEPFPVAVPMAAVGPGGESRGAAALLDGLRHGVVWTRALTLVPPKTYLRKRVVWDEVPTFDAWRSVGASGVVRASLESVGADTRFKLQLIDVVRQKVVLEKHYDADARYARHIAFRFLDEVVEALTGEAGVLSSQLAYVKKTEGGKAIYVCDIDGTGERRLTDVSTLSLLPAWDPSRRQIFFTSFANNNPDLFRLDLETGRRAVVSAKSGLNMGASVSPDGRRVAFTLSLSGNTEIFVADIDGQNAQRLTRSWGQDLSPSWSPDGTRIAFVSTRSGNPHIYVMRADGREVRRITFSGNYNQEPDWSPRADGRIAFTGRDEHLRFDIFLVDPKTSQIERLTEGRGNSESPSHSPDGQHIVFTSDRGGQGRRVYVMDIDGKNVRLLTAASGVYETPAWGPRVQLAQAASRSRNK